jgi:hypothetical protein
VTIQPVTNTRELPAGECIAVQSGDESNAIASLLAIAKRRGLSIGEKAYRWGQGYYYVEITKEAA